MSEVKHPDQTVDYYNEQARQYVAETVDLDVSNIRTLFLNLIPDGGHILDLGCGSGRDSRFFIDQGYSVIAIDASHQLASLASQFIGQTVKNLTFQELDYSETFDGIWACASLLHCPKLEICVVIQRMTKALKPDGIIYMSFKHGVDERFDERGRFFNDYTEASMANMLAEHSALQSVDIFTESKPLRTGVQKWLNVFVKKTR